MERRWWTQLWILALVWGASYLLIKLALEDLEPAFLVWSRLALAALVLIPLAARANAFAGLRGKGPALVLNSLVQIVGPFLLITYGEERITSSLTGILVASAPIFTALIGLSGPAHDRVNRWSMAGILTGLVGVALLFGIDLTGSTSTLIGGLMILGASVGYAFGAIGIRRDFAGIAPLGVAAGSMTTSAILLAPAVVLAAPSEMPGLKATSALVALGVLGTGVAFFMFYRLIAEVGPSRASIVAYLAPGFAVAYGAIFLSEPVTLGAVGGLAFILAGCWMAAEGRAPWERKPAAAPVTA